MSKLQGSARLVWQIAVAVPLRRTFDYWPPEQAVVEAQPGIRVLVPFGNAKKVGVLMGIAAVESCLVQADKLKPVERVLDAVPLLSDCDLQLLRWASRYYHHPIGEVAATAFPVALRQGKPAVLHKETYYALSEQALAVEPAALKRAPKQLALLALLQHAARPMALSELTEHKAALKALVQKGWVQPQTERGGPVALAEKPPALEANAEQQQAIDAVVAGLGHFSVVLLQGVTGSGKTEVYMQVIAEVLQRGLQALVLLPEITLTPQLEQRFRQRFPLPIVCSHSKLNDNQRLQAWLSMQQGEAAILLGTRSALFTPLPRPGLIILDEEHDASFKQQEGFRFSARDVAIARGKMLNVPVLLGSATPSLESLYNAMRGRYRLMRLSARAGSAVEPELQILDIRNKPLQAGLSEPLVAEMRKTLARGRQVLLFLNRRGFAPVLICHGCGWVARCPRCDANMVIHAAERRLRCHHCGTEHTLPTHCPACTTGELQPLGLGTERIEQALAQLFPGKRVVRLDRDTTQRKGSLENYLEQIHSGQADIVLGTQMLAKGHHFPEVTLVAILDIDSGLFSVDFRSSEKLAQMIVQVAGRAGRADMPGRVVLQTRQPQHPLLMTLLAQGYQAFAEEVLAERRQAGLPPFAFQALFRVQAHSGTEPQLFLQAVADLLADQRERTVQVLGPVAAPMARRAGLFRFQLLLQSPGRPALHALLARVLPQITALKSAQKVRWSLDVDPVDLY